MPEGTVLMIDFWRFLRSCSSDRVSGLTNGNRAHTTHNDMYTQVNKIIRKIGAPNKPTSFLKDWYCRRLIEYLYFLYWQLSKEISIAAGRFDVSIFRCFQILLAQSFLFLLLFSNSFLLFRSRSRRQKISWQKRFLMRKLSLSSCHCFSSAFLQKTPSLHAQRHYFSDRRDKSLLSDPKNMILQALNHVLFDAKVGAG